MGSRWDFDDGTIGTVTHPNKSFDAAGTKQVKLVSVSQFGCLDSVVHSIIIKPSPLVDFSFDKTCDVDPVNFENLTQEPSGSVVIYTWDFGDGGISSQKNPQHKYDVLGVSTVKLLAQSNNGCSQSLSKDVLIQVQPNADFDVGDVCSGDATQFINKTRISAGEVRYKWYFGDGDSSDFNSPTKEYVVNTTTIYVIKLVAQAVGGCEDVIAKNVTIHEKPECGFTFTQSKEDRRTFKFIPNNTSYGDNAYTWVFKGSGRSNEVSPEHTFHYFDDRYNIILDITGDNGCTCYDSTTIITTSWPLSVSNVDLQNDIEVFPNPTSGAVHIRSLTSTLSKAEIYIYAADGRRVAEFKEKVLSGNITTLDLSHLASGFYQLELWTDGRKMVNRLVLTN